MKNRTYKSLSVFLVTLILLSTFTFFVSTSAQDKNLVEKAELSFGVVDKASASLVFGEKNCSVKPLVFGSDKVFSECRGPQNKVTLNSEKYNVLVEDVANGVEYVLVVKDKLERGFVEFEVDTMGYSVRQDGSLLTELPKKEYVVWNETYAFDGQNITRKDISLVGCLRFIPDGQIMEEFIIKRPYIYDSLGTGVWGEQTLNGNVLTVTVPKEFLEKAVYPIYVDPTIIFSDGFESNDFSAWTGTNGSPAVQSAIVHHGSYAMNTTGDSFNGAYWYSDGVTYNSLYFRSYIYYDTFPSGAIHFALDLCNYNGPNLNNYLILKNTGTNYVAYVEHGSGVSEEVEVSLSLDTWHCVELFAEIDTGNIKVWFDGVEKINYTAPIPYGDLLRYAMLSRWSTSADLNCFFDCCVVSDSYIGPEPTGPEILEVELNMPSNASTITDYVQNFIYTPTLYGSDSIQNASLYINNLLVASNATAITNATANTISYTFASNGEYEWTIGVYNSTHLVFPYGNYTITVSVNDSLSEVEKSDYTTIILFVISLILCIIGLALTVPLLPLISITISVLNIIFLSEPTIFNILLTLLSVTFTVIALVRAKTQNN